MTKCSPSCRPKRPREGAGIRITVFLIDRWSKRADYLWDHTGISANDPAWWSTRKDYDSLIISITIPGIRSHKHMLTIGEIKNGIFSLPSTVRKYGFIGGSKRLTALAYFRLHADSNGRSIFEKPWDVCIILDACRADELTSQRTNFEWIDNVGRFPSLGSCTWDWLPRTLEETDDEILQDTVYVCANPFSGEFCTEGQFYELDEVWRYAWNEDKGTVYPRPVTDRAIHHGRTTDASRLLVHYLQPHVPFLSAETPSLSRENFDFDANSSPDAWDQVTRGELSRETAIRWYRQSLKYVLEDVQLLLTNLDADRVVLTADHGEAFGEWGIYGHPENINLSCLTEVPWLETEATDKDAHTPAEYDREPDSVHRTDQLEALGYTT